MNNSDPRSSKDTNYPPKEPEQSSQFPTAPSLPSDETYANESIDTTEINKSSETDRSEPPLGSNQNKENFNEKIGNSSSSKNTDPLYNFAHSNREKIITYSLLVLGLLCMLFISDIIGELIIGLVGGYYFGSEIVNYIRNISEAFGDQLKYVVLAAVLLALFIAAPGIFVGAVIMAAIKQGIIQSNNR